MKEIEDKVCQWLRLVLTSYRRHWETEGKEKPKAAEIAATGELFDAAVKEIGKLISQTRLEALEEAAKVAEEVKDYFGGGYGSHDFEKLKTRNIIVEAIRTLAKKED